MIEMIRLIDREFIFALLRVIFLVAAGFLLARLLSLGLARLLKERADHHRLTLAQRGSFYLIFGLFIISALIELGFNFGVFLGAAGILTVALGFAAQTSMSNLISGLFLIGEHPFAIGDVITINGNTGVVLSIDLLSVKLRTFQNTFVRIPNEMIIKSPVTNLTKFPIRRIDLRVIVSVKEDIARVQKVLFEVAERNPLCLEEPNPLFIFQGYRDSAIEIQFSVWASSSEFLPLQNSIQIDIKAAFEREKIDIPFPHRVLFTTSETDPFPVQILPEPSDRPDDEATKK
jgi:small-conductance mechanosensitive channel